MKKPKLKSKFVEKKKNFCSIKKLRIQIMVAIKKLHIKIFSLHDSYDKKIMFRKKINLGIRRSFETVAAV